MNQKIRIKLKSYDHNLVDKSSEKIVRAVKATGCCGKRTNSVANRKGKIHRFAFTTRKQEIA
jgi:ribosomal protein S10